MFKVKRILLNAAVLMAVLFSMGCPQETVDPRVGDSGTLTVYVNDKVVKKANVILNEYGNSVESFDLVEDKTYVTYVGTEVTVKMEFSDSIKSVVSEFSYYFPSYSNEYKSNEIDEKSFKFTKIKRTGSTADYKESKSINLYCGTNSLSFDIIIYDSPILWFDRNIESLKHGDHLLDPASLSGNINVKDIIADSGETFVTDEIIYTSDDTSIIDFKNNYIRAEGVGSATITAKIKGNNSVSITKTVTIKPREVKLENNSLTLQNVGSPVLGFKVVPTTEPDFPVTINQSVTPYSGWDKVILDDCLTKGDSFSFKTTGQKSINVYSEYNSDATSKNLTYSVLEKKSNLSISGYSKSSAGGEVLQGTEVVLYSGDGVEVSRVTTDATGKYAFTGLSADSYSLVSNKTNYATAKHQDIPLYYNNFTTDLIQHPVVTNSRSLNPPNVKIYKGDIEISKNTNFKKSEKINIVGSGNNPVVGNSFREAIYIKINNDSNSNSLGASYSSEAQIYLPDNLDDYKSGANWLAVTVFDNNNNNTTKYILFSVLQNSYETPVNVPVTDSRVTVSAITIGKNQHLYSNNGYTNIIELSANGSYGKGLRVYRSESLNGVYALIGEIFIKEGSNFVFRDLSGDLKPASIYYYKLSYIYYNREGDLSPVITVETLPEYTLELVSPGHNSITDSNPTFEWRANISEAMPAGAIRKDMIIVEDQLIGAPVDIMELENTNNYNVQNGLPPGGEYRWNISSRYIKSNTDTANITINQISLPGSTTILSLYDMYGNRQDIPVNYSNNGWFNFITNGSSK